MDEIPYKIRRLYNLPLQSFSSLQEIEETKIEIESLFNSFSLTEQQKTNLYIWWTHIIYLKQLTLYNQGREDPFLKRKEREDDYEDEF